MFFFPQDLTGLCEFLRHFLEVFTQALVLVRLHLAPCQIYSLSARDGLPADCEAELLSLPGLLYKHRVVALEAILA